ncbi:uncharacterized protein LOC129810490 [Phlebotomus papatasi]|uniref:uncharacterized protein LOC129810490 n=1 Tax=Phlebotomus papatasi TaxID=29031 RepID=UPI0024844D8A|nr:uncharacterized protein LOC129810490 [Phlebotomus papatasi]
MSAMEQMNYKQKAIWKVLEEEIGGEIPGYLKKMFNHFNHTSIRGLSLFKIPLDMHKLEEYMKKMELSSYNDIVNERPVKEKPEDFYFTRPECHISSFVNCAKDNTEKLIEKYAAEVRAIESMAMKKVSITTQGANAGLV